MTKDFERGRGLLCRVAIAVALCSCTDTELEEISTKQQLITAADVLEFESLEHWTSNSSSLTLSDLSHSGAASLKAVTAGYTTIQSATIGSPGLIGDALGLSVRMESPVSWGEVRIVLRVPSLGEYWRDIGGFPLSDLSAKTFHQLAFSLPDDLKVKLTQQTYSDLSITVVLNAPSGSFRLDSINFALGLPSEPVEPARRSFQVFAAAVQAGAVLSASDWLVVGDRSKVLSKQGQPGALANVGTGTTTIGTDATVGTTFAAGHVDIRDRAKVNGDLWAPTHSLGNAASVLGAIQTSPPGPTGEAYPPGVELFDVGTNVHLEPGTSLELQPGDYGSLQVKSNSVLQLQNATYRFSTVHVEPGATIETASLCGPSRVYVRDGFFFRGRLQHEGTGPGLIILHEGASSVNIESSFEGFVMAPNAELVLSSHSHVGRFFAKRIRVQPDATVTSPVDFVAGDQCVREFTELPEISPQDLGPAPVLEHATDLPAFLSWYLNIRTGELEEAATVISSVADAPGVAAAAMEEFEESRHSDFARSSMLLSLLAALPNGAGDGYLLTLLNQPIVDQDPSASLSPAELEMLYRSKVMYALATKGVGTDELRAIAVGHPLFRVRGEAIRTLAFHQSEAFVEELRNDLVPGDDFHLERPNRNSPDFTQREAEFVETYDPQHPWTGR